MTTKKQPYFSRPRNIPRRVTPAEPDQGPLVDADFSALELALLRRMLGDRP